MDETTDRKMTTTTAPFNWGVDTWKLPEGQLSDNYFNDAHNASMDWNSKLHDELQALRDSKQEELTNNINWDAWNDAPSDDLFTWRYETEEENLARTEGLTQDELRDTFAGWDGRIHELTAKGQSIRDAAEGEDERINNLYDSQIAALEEQIELSQQNMAAMHAAQDAWRENPQTIEAEQSQLHDVGAGGLMPDGTTGHDFVNNPVSIQPIANDDVGDWKPGDSGYGKYVVGDTLIEGPLPPGDPIGIGYGWQDKEYPKYAADADAYEQGSPSVGLPGGSDFYDRQTGPIYDGYGNVTGFNHGYGDTETFPEPIPVDDYKGPGHGMGDDEVSIQPIDSLTPEDLQREGEFLTQAGRYQNTLENVWGLNRQNIEDNFPGIARFFGQPQAPTIEDTLKYLEDSGAYERGEFRAGDNQPITSERYLAGDTGDTQTELDAADKLIDQYRGYTGPGGIAKPEDQQRVLEAQGRANPWHSDMFINPEHSGRQDVLDGYPYRQHPLYPMIRDQGLNLLNAQQIAPYAMNWWNQGRRFNEGSMRVGDIRDLWRPVDRVDPNTLTGNDRIQRGQSNVNYQHGKPPNPLGRIDRSIFGIDVPESWDQRRLVTVPADQGGPGSSPTPMVRQVFERGTKHLGNIGLMIQAFNQGRTGSDVDQFAQQTFGEINPLSSTANAQDWQHLANAQQARDQGGQWNLGGITIPELGLSEYLGINKPRTHTQNMQIRRHTDTNTGQAKERLAINAGPSTGTGRTPFEPNPKQYTRTY